tara:strand:- start:71 stop:235 length:165 start_codon:yes stop_codon:yes gene_type:complete
VKSQLPKNLPKASPGQYGQKSEKLKHGYLKYSPYDIEQQSIEEQDGVKLPHINN